MDDLKQFYRNGLPKRIKTLEESLAQCQKGNSEAKDTLLRTAHSLHGSGASYGFPLISKVAGELENASNRDIPQQTEKLISVLRDVASGSENITDSILIIDDDPDIRVLLKKKLANLNVDVFSADTGRKAEEILDQERISLVILDLILPDIDGRNLLARLRRHPGTAMIQVIILSVKVGSKLKAECFSLGADEYFEKPFDPDLLVAAISARLLRAREIARESQRDTLTGLSTRTGFSQSFSKVVSLCRRLGQSLSLAILDIDHFKSVNDTYGHDAGDLVLRDVASIMSQSLRGSDILARWGGEEFVILFPDTDLKGATSVLEKILRKVRDEDFPTRDGRTFRVTFSAGAVEVKDDITVEDAVARADIFLYHAKSAGRNRVVSELNKTPAERKTVLLAEDDERMAHLVIKNLAVEGFDCIHCIDGTEALVKAPESGVSLVILDVNMPGLSGFDVLTELRKRPSYMRTPIVMLTCMGSEKDIVRGFKRGADDYILKPFSVPELMARIQRLLARP